MDSGIVKCFSNRIKASSPQTQGSERYGNPTRHSEGATKPPDGTQPSAVCPEQHSPGRPNSVYYHSFGG